jgi:hypothetical protein
LNSSGITNAVSSYRTYKLPWTGHPLTKPDLVYSASTHLAHLSWNGATEVRTWGIYTAATAGDANAWTSVLNATRRGFETEIDLSNVTGQLQAFVVGHAFDGDGVSLGWTRASDGQALVNATTPDVPRPPASETSSSPSASATAKSAASRSVELSAGLFVVALMSMLLLCC